MVLPEAQRIAAPINVQMVHVERKKVGNLKIQPTAPKSPSGWFWLPKINTQRGQYYLVHAEEGEHWAKVTVLIPTSLRTLSELELVYVRSCFFQSDAVVVSYIAEGQTYIEMTGHLEHVPHQSMWCSMDRMSVPAQLISKRGKLPES
jgi:hypothetical protein